MDNLPPGASAFEKLLPYRLVLSAGVLFMLIQLLTDGVGGVVNAVVSVAAATVIVGTPGVLALVITGIVLAGPRRRELWADSKKLFRVALLTTALVLFGIGDILPFWPDGLSFNALWNYVNTGSTEGDPTGQALADLSSEGILLAFALWPIAWYLLFFLPSAAYLVHNNSFGVAQGSAFEPWIWGILSWSIAISFPILSTIGDDFIGVPKSALLVLNALLVSAIAVYQLRKTGASLRNGPWSGVDEQQSPSAATGLAIRSLGRVVHLGFAVIYGAGMAILFLFLFVNLLFRGPSLL